MKEEKNMKEETAQIEITDIEKTESEKIITVDNPVLDEKGDLKGETTLTVQETKTIKLEELLERKANLEATIARDQAEVDSINATIAGLK